MLHAKLVIFNVAKLLLGIHHLDVNKQTDDGYTPLYSLIDNSTDESDVLPFLKNLLYDSRCDPNISDNRGMTPFHLACCVNNIQFIEILINTERCDPNIGDNHGSIPLHESYCMGNTAIIQFLLQNPKIDIHKQNSEYFTVFHLCVIKKMWML